MLNGVQIHITKEYGLCHISEFSDDIKQALRKNLTRICHGEEKSISNYAIYRYKPTVRSFLDRYKNKPEKTKKGMIGEFLSHVIINELFDTFETASPFFNLEEKSIKKGFDILLYSTETNNLWITEVKSGELHKDKDENQTTTDLLNTAYNDLKFRLNENEMNHWYNAMNAASAAVSQNKDYRKAILDILASEGEKSSEEKSTSLDNNVFFISTLFHDINFKTTNQVVKDFHSKISKKCEFANIFCFSVQKSTLNKVVDFLIEESK